MSEVIVVVLVVLVVVGSVSLLVLNLLALVFVAWELPVKILVAADLETLLSVSLLSVFLLDDPGGDPIFAPGPQLLTNMNKNSDKRTNIFDFNACFDIS